jgi:hypothetical protein
VETKGNNFLRMRREGGSTCQHLWSGFKKNTKL